MVTILTPKVGGMAKIKKGKGERGKIKGRKKALPRHLPAVALPPSP
jgi:hypothetical protein